MKKVACRTHKMIVPEGKPCPICKKTNLSNSWQGRIYFTNIEKSFIAQKMKIDREGEYALKVK